MPRSGLKPHWTQIAERVEKEGQSEVLPQHRMFGHPTAPGLREARVNRDGGPSPGNGQPGRPVTVPGRRGTFGTLSNTGGGYPVQGGPDGNDFELDTDF